MTMIKMMMMITGAGPGADGVPGAEQVSADGGGGPEAEAAGCPGRHQGEDGQSSVTVSSVRSGD